MIPKRVVLLLGFIAFVLLYVVLPLFHEVCGHDVLVLLNWIDQFTLAFRNGTLYPRWMPESFYGMGMPSFYFYPPLVYWVASVVSFIQPGDLAFAYYGALLLGA